VPVYYYTLGRKLFGRQILYPLLRLGHLPEWFLGRRLYLNLNRAPRRQVPEHLQIPEHRYRPAIPELEVLAGD
jgi:hypothetical protein